MRARSLSSSAAGSLVRPPWTGPGCTTVLRGAASQPKRWPRVSQRGTSGRLFAAADGGYRLKRRVNRREVQVWRQGFQPVATHDERAVQEVGRLAVDDDADVRELVSVDARDTAQHDVLVAHQWGGHEEPARGSHADGSSRRASRLRRYAVRTASASGMASVGSSHSSGIWARAPRAASLGVPHQQVGVAPCAVHVGGERIQPQDPARLVG